MSIETYDPSQVTLLLALIYPVESFAPDSIVSLTKDESYYTTSKGATGGVERVHLNDTTYTLEISLSQTSSSNAVLNAFAALDNASRRGVFPIYLKDNSGNSLFLAESCWIENPPEVRYTNSVEPYRWSVKCTGLTFGIAGNGDLDVIERVGQLGSLIGSFGANKGIF